MASFRLPPVLRPMAGGARTVEAGGDSLRAALENLTGQHPALRSRLLGDDGEIAASSTSTWKARTCASAAGSIRPWPPTPT